MLPGKGVWTSDITRNSRFGRPGAAPRRRLGTVGVAATVLAAAVSALVPPSSARPAATGPFVLVADRSDTSPPLRERAGRTVERRELPAGATGGGTLLGPIENFAGLGSEDDRALGEPADHAVDPVGDVGPRHYVQWVNYVLAVYDKHGRRLLGPIRGNTVWAGLGGPCATTNRGDPIVLYDEQEDRWLLSQFAWNRVAGRRVAPFYQCIAVSATGDPTGSYHRYAFVMPGDFLNDYAKFGVWSDGYYMTDLKFGAFTGRQGVRAFAFERAKMLRGEPARAIGFELDRGLGGLLPADLDGPLPPPHGTASPFVAVDDARDEVQIWLFDANFDDPTRSTFAGPTRLSAEFDSHLCNEAGEACVPQHGTPTQLDAMSDRPMFRAAYRNFGGSASLVASHTVDATGDDHAGVRWYEIRDPTGAATIARQQTYAPDAAHRWMGSAAIDRAGGVGLGFSLSSASLYPSIGYAAVSAEDPVDAMRESEGRLATGAAAQTGGTRWADYSSLTVDPVDGCTFWYTQEYYAAAAAWHTRVGSFKLERCGAVPTIAGGPREGVTLAASPGEWSHAPSPTFRYRWRRCDARGTSCADIPGATADSYAPGETDVGATLRVVVTASSAAGVASSVSRATSPIAPSRTDVPAADLVLASTFSAGIARLGRRVSASARVENAGDGVAARVRLNVTLPAGLGLVAASPDQGGCTRTRPLSCELGSLAPGESATVTVFVRPTVRGVLVLGASVDAAGADRDPSTNHARAVVTVRGAPRLALQSRAPLVPGGRARATVVSARIRIDEAARLTASVRGRATPTSLVLLPGSTATPGTVRKRASALDVDVRAAGTVRFVLRVQRAALRAGRRYTLVVEARDWQGERATLRVAIRRVSRR